MHERIPLGRDTIRDRNAKILEVLASKGIPVLPFERQVIEAQLKDVMDEQDERGKELRVVNTQSSETWHDNHAANEIERYSKVISARGNALVEALRSTEEIGYPPEGTEVTVGSIIGLSFSAGSEPSPHFLTGTVRDIRGLFDETLPEGCTVVTVQSPLGQALLGAQAGEAVSYQVRGNSREVLVSSVQQLILPD
jgi:transcription elongation GreA/GreB family factor